LTSLSITLLSMLACGIFTNIQGKKRAANEDRRQDVYQDDQSTKCLRSSEDRRSGSFDFKRGTRHQGLSEWCYAFALEGRKSRVKFFEERGSERRRNRFLPALGQQR
jgi:hypothetical protein